MGLQCNQPVKITGTSPPAFRPCQFSAAEGETKCARHGGRPMRPRRMRGYRMAMAQFWRAVRALVGR